MRSFAILISVLSAFAHAEETSAVSTTITAQPKWSLGAGIGFGDSSFAFGGLGALGGLGGFGWWYQAFTPTPRLSFERIFSEHFVLGLGLTASYEVGSSPTFGPVIAGSTLSRNESGSTAISLFPRWILTNADSPVAFSVYAAATGGYAAVRIGYPEEEPQIGRSYSVGLNGGITLERMLIERLALRISTQIVHATLAQNFIQSTSTPAVLGSAVTQTSTTAQASVVPSPSIELRLYF